MGGLENIDTLNVCLVISMVLIDYISLLTTPRKMTLSIDNVPCSPHALHSNGHYNLVAIACVDDTLIDDSSHKKKHLWPKPTPTINLHFATFHWWSFSKTASLTNSYTIVYNYFLIYSFLLHLNHTKT